MVVDAKVPMGLLLVVLQSFKLCKNIKSIRLYSDTCSINHWMNKICSESSENVN